MHVLLFLFLSFVITRLPALISIHLYLAIDGNCIWFRPRFNYKIWSKLVINVCAPKLINVLEIESTKFELWSLLMHLITLKWVYSLLRMHQIFYSLLKIMQMSMQAYRSLLINSWCNNWQIYTIYFTLILFKIIKKITCHFLERGMINKLGILHCQLDLRLVFYFYFPGRVAISLFVMSLSSKSNFPKAINMSINYRQLRYIRFKFL